MSIQKFLSFIFDFLDEDMRITGAELYEKYIIVYFDDDTQRKIIVR